LIHTSDGVVLADWDSVSYGPREQDLVPTRMRRRFGQPASEWSRFCKVYGIDPGQLEGLTVLQQMRELRALSPYIRTEHPAAQAEAVEESCDLRVAAQHQWSRRPVVNSSCPPGAVLVVEVSGPVRQRKIAARRQRTPQGGPDAARALSVGEEVQDRDEQKGNG